METEAVVWVLDSPEQTAIEVVEVMTIDDLEEPELSLDGATASPGEATTTPGDDAWFVDDGVPVVETWQLQAYRLSAWDAPRPA